MSEKSLKYVLVVTKFHSNDQGGFTMRNSIRNLNLLQYVYFMPKNKQNFDHPVSLMQSILNSCFLYFVEGLCNGLLNLHLF